MAESSSTSIEFRHLRYFLAVVEELHFGHAAERLHISQPPLSQAIRKLEEELGVQLLERTSRIVKPTRAGLVFAEQARRLVAGVDEAVAEVRRAGGASPVLRVGCSPYVPIAWTHRFLTALRQRVPSLEPDVVHLLFAEQVARLRAGDLAIGLFRHADQIDEIETAQIGAGDSLAAILPEEHSLAVKPALGAEDLSDETLILPPRSLNAAMYDWLLTVLTDAGFRFDAIRETQGGDPRDVLIAVRSGVGVGIAPSSLSDDGESDSGLVWRPLAPQVVTPDAIVAWRSNPPAELASLIGIIRELARDLKEREDDSRGMEQ